MRIDGLTVSVDYADKLENGLDRWLEGLDSLIVVTSTADTATQQLCAARGVGLWVTDAFYEDDAWFNKGRAMEEARKALSPPEWLLLFDADIIPPEGWRQSVEAAIKPGWLYGAWRYVDGGERARDDQHGYGYFQLFHAADPLAQANPLFDVDWSHGGNYDSFLMLRWREVGRLAPPLPLHLVHQGPVDHNWFGVGNPEKFAEMERERRRRGGGWPSIEYERLTSR